VPPAERIPRGKPPPGLARRGEVVTKTQELRPALSCEPLPNHVLPLPLLVHFGATSDVCDTAAWCGPTAIMLAREAGSLNITHYDLKAHHASVGGW
jgi:hypothetical protein